MNFGSDLRAGTPEIHNGHEPWPTKALSENQVSETVPVSAKNSHRSCSQIDKSMGETGETVG